MDSSFVHLHNHSEYSLLDGAQRIPKMVERAVQLEMPALALTDHGVMYGSLEFYDTCKANGIKPIIGVEAYIAPGAYTDKTPRPGKQAFHLVLLAENEKGYKNLLKLSTMAALEGYYYKPRIDKDILATHAEGLIGTTACLGSEVCQALINDNYKKALELAGQYKEIFGRDNFFVELQDHNIPLQAKIKDSLLKIAKDLELGVICSNDAHYLCQGDAGSHDVLLCIQTNTTIDDPNRMRYPSQEFYLKSHDEMAKLFGDMPNAMALTGEIAQRCNLDLEFGRLQLPAPDLPNNTEPHDYIKQLCEKAIPDRYKEITPEVTERLAYELKIIDETKFSSYFLIVRDFAQFARDQGIFFGVRGSAAGSLVSYCLGITDIDPIDYSLTFERFLNPERIAMPDIDMDFEDARRDEVIKYVTEKYGQDHVAQIVTFGTMGARGSIRDAGRALDIQISEVEKAVKCIPTIPVGMTITKALEQVPEFKSVYNSNEVMRQLIDTARSIEGISRNTSTHAAGVVISKDPLVEHVPLGRGTNGENVTQYGAASLEKIGLLKMDFLGLANLSVLAKAVRNIKRSRDTDIDVLKLPMDDSKTFNLLTKGDVVGVFQLEGGGMRRNLMQLKPRNIRDLAAMVALYRPGPMEQIPKFIPCKQKLESISYPHPSLAPILEETYGIIVYQDQVLRIVQAIGGFTLGQADILRKAMGKKQKETMEKTRSQFIEGAKTNGISESKANEIFELMAPFAGYAFNKAHATCYGTIAYQTAYLKANFPAEYMAALMAVYRDREDKIIRCVEECRRFGIELLAPDVNLSDRDFTFETKTSKDKDDPIGCVRFGLCCLKGVGESAIEALLKAREEGGKFTSIFDLCERTREQGTFTRNTLESLIYAGALDSLNPNRAQLKLSIDGSLAFAERAAREKESGQNSLFESDGKKKTQNHYPSLPIVPNWSKMETLIREKEVLGVYLSDHPLRSVSSQLSKLTNTDIESLPDHRDNDSVTVGGMITNIRATLTKKNKEKMAVITIEDTTGSAQVTIFPRTLAAHHLAIKKDAIVLIKGRVTFRDNINAEENTKEVELRAETVTEIHPHENQEDADDNSGKIFIYLEKASRPQLATARNILRESPGDYDVFIDIRVKGKAKRTLLPIRVKGSEEIAKKLQQVLETVPGNRVKIQHVDRFEMINDIVELEEVSPGV